MNAITYVGRIGPGWLARSVGGRDWTQAIDRAYATFALQHPAWAASLFDKHFLTRGAAAPLFERAIRDAVLPEPVALARAWAEQMHFKGTERDQAIAQLTPAASDFLRRLAEELARQ